MWWVSIKVPKRPGETKHRVHRYVVMADNEQEAGAKAREEYGDRPITAVHTSLMEEGICHVGVILQN